MYTNCRKRCLRFSMSFFSINLVFRSYCKGMNAKDVLVQVLVLSCRELRSMCGSGTMCFIFIHLSILYIEYIHNRNNKHVYRTPTFYLFAVHSIIHNYTGNNYSLHFLPTTQSYFSLVPLLTPALIPDISPPYLFISVLGSRN